MPSLFLDCRGSCNLAGPEHQEKLNAQRVQELAMVPMHSHAVEYFPLGTFRE